MTRSNVVFDSIMEELEKVPETEDIRAEVEDRTLSDGETDINAFPPSLLRYFESSKSRAAECEKLILRPEDYFESRHTEDKINQWSELTDEGMKQKEGVICDQDLGLFTAPPDTDEQHAYSVSMCPVDEGDAETETDPQTEMDSVFEERTVKISQSEEESLEGDGYEAEREKLRCEELGREEQRRQTEDDFQKELKRIIEAEKLQQMELELMEKKAQEKLEREMLLQQEVISSLQRRVEEERKRLEEEKKRLKEKKEDERREEEERKKMEEEQKRLKEGEDKRREEEERKKMETEKRRIEEERRRKEEEMRKREEERMRKEAERSKLEEEERMKTEEIRLRRVEEGKNKEKEEKSLLDIKKKKLQDDMRMRKEGDGIKREEGDSLRKEEERKVAIDRRQKEEVLKMEKSKNKQEVIQVTKTEEENLGNDRKVAEDQRKRKEEDRTEMKRERMEKEIRKKKEEEREIDEEKLRKREDKEEKNRVKKEEGRKREEPRNKIELEKVKVEEEGEMMKKKEEMQKKMEPERMKKDDDERTRAEDVTETENEEQKSDDEMILEKEEGVRRMLTLKNIHQAERKRDKKENGNHDKDMISRDRKQREEEKREDERIVEMEKKVTKDKEDNIKSPLVEDVGKKKDNNRNTREEDQTKRSDASVSKEEEKVKIRMDDEPLSEGGDGIQHKDNKERFKRSDKAKRKEELEGKMKSKKENWKEAKMQRDQVEHGVDGRENGGQNEEEVGGNVKEEDKETGKEIRIKEKEKNAKEVQDTEMGNKRKETEHHSINEKNHKDKAETFITKNSAAFSNPGPSQRKTTVSSICTKTAPQQYDQDKITTQTSKYKTTDCKGPFSAPKSFPVCLPEHTEQKRLSWMKECVPWSKLSLLNKRKQRGPPRSGRGMRRAAEASGLPPLCPDTLLQSTGWSSLKEVTTVTLEDLPGCSLSTIAQCPQLQSLTLRRCGLKSLEGLGHLQQLCSIDVKENDISFINCENMKSLRVLKLSHNKLASIHGLTGAEKLDVLELSHNSITRIAGLESLRRLQRLSLDHNQLISTKGLKDVYTLLHLNCSHNHLVKVEGLENNVLLNTLDLRANSLTEPPSLNNHVLLRELRLDDNSISSLQSLAARWLPLTQRLSVAQNRITQLPPMSDFVSLQSLDLRFNCLSELHNVNQSLEGCQFLQVLLLKGNPLQQENGWRSSLQKALPGLRAVDDQEIDSSPLPPARQFSLASGSFFTFCQALLQQTHDLREQHCRELSQASSPLDAIKTSCQHFTEALKLAEDQRFAHEYGDTSVADDHDDTGRTTQEGTPDMGCNGAEEHTKQIEMQFIEKTVAVASKKDIFHCSYWTLEEKPPLVDRHDTVSTVTAGLRTEQTACEVESSRVKSSATKEKKSLSKCVMDSITINQDLNLQNGAAVVIQQMWRKYWQKCGNIGSMSTAERGGDGGGDEGGGGGTPESGPSLNNRDVLGRESAATFIQAVWRGFTLRRRLTSALAAVTCSDIGEDDTFEEVDVDEFVFDEAALEKQWTPLCEDQPPRCYSESELLLSLKPPGAFPESTQTLPPHPLVWRSKQAWVDEEQEVSAEQKVSPVSSNRGKSPASAPLLSGLSERSEQILEEWGFTNSHTALLMLKRAQKMKSKKQQQKKNPSTHLALFKTCSYHKDPAGAQKRPMKHNRNNIEAIESELGLQQTPRTEQTRQDKAQQRPHARAAHMDNNSESVHFLPEISTDILHGGRVQLVADLGYSERQHHANGSWANSSLAARPCRENRHLHRNSSGKEASSSKRVSSTLSNKERISFRDNHVQLSGGWGGGKKRDRENK